MAAVPMLPRLPSPLALLVPLAPLACAGAHAMGGHFAVDDASTLASGDCQLELWAQRAAGGFSLQHAGPACGWRGVELGLNLERARANRGEPTVWLAAPQVKWASDPRRPIAVGLVATVARWSRDPRDGAALLVPLTWRPVEALQLHANLGRDWVRGAPARTRRGLAFEWSASERWTGIAEWLHDGAASAARGGLRWSPAPSWSLDASVARGGLWSIGWTVGPVSAGAAPPR